MSFIPLNLIYLTCTTAGIELVNGNYNNCHDDNECDAHHTWLAFISECVKNSCAREYCSENNCWLVNAMWAYIKVADLGWTVVMVIKQHSANPAAGIACSPNMCLVLSVNYSFSSDQWIYLNNCSFLVCNKFRVTVFELI